MTLLEEISYPEDQVINSYSITKIADNALYHYAKQLNCSEDQALDMLLRYMSLTENINKFLKDIDQKFKVTAWQ